MGLGGGFRLGRGFVGGSIGGSVGGRFGRSLSRGLGGLGRGRFGGSLSRSLSRGFSGLGRGRLSGLGSRGGLGGRRGLGGRGGSGSHDRAGSEDRLQSGRIGHAADSQVVDALEPLDGFLGVLAVAAALLGQVAQLNQALVQLADALARVAALQGDVGAADGRVGREQPAQGGHGGLTGHAQAAFLLEQLHGVLRAAAKLAVGRVGQVAQLAQAVLQILHANAGVAAGFHDVLDVLGRVGGVQLLLDRRAGNAVLAQAGLILEVEQGDASLFAEYAVRLAGRRSPAR